MTSPVAPAAVTYLSATPPAKNAKPTAHTSVADPPAKIDVANASETDYWAYRLGVSREQLFSAIEAVGSSVAAVRHHLHK